MDLFPIYRIEHFLDAIVSGTTPPEPVAPASVEFYLAKIAGADVQIPAFPISRVDHFLAKICGQDVPLPIPQSREERYLAKIAGEDVEIPPFPINRIDFWLAEWANGGGGEILSVTGVSPLLLENALQHKLISLTQTGKCEQASTPTPAVPVPILCNNGELKYGVYSKNLFDKNTMDTGQGYYVNTSGNIVNGYNANRTVWIPCKPNTKYSYWHTEGAGGCRAFAMNKDTIDTSDTSEWLKGSPAFLGKNVVSTVTTPADAVKLYITAARSNLDPERSFDEQLADFMVVEGEVAVASPYEPYKFGLYTVGAPEVLTVKSANLFDASAVPDENKYVQQATGGLVSPTSVDSTFVHSDFVPVVGGNTYFFGQTAYSAQAAGLAWYSEPSDTAYISGKSGTSLKNAGMILTAPSDAKYVRFSIRTSEGYDSDWQHSVYLCEVVDGSPVLTAWQAYSAQTATVPNLFAVGDYADEAEIISGLLTHKVGVKVLDGTEDWGQNATYNRFTTQVTDMVTASTTRSLPFWSTHFVVTYSATTNYGYIYNGANNTTVMITHDAADVTAFKAWLAAQYAAGTPVIVVYPLATPTTETVDGQPLSTAQGTNTVTAVTNVDPVTLTCEYKGVAA